MKILKIIRIVFQVAFALGALCAAFVGGMLISKGFGVLPGIILVFVSFALWDRKCWGWDCTTGITGVLMCFSFVFSLSATSLRVVYHEDNGYVEVVQSFYPLIGKSVAEGVRIDTVRCASHYTTYYGTYDVSYDDKYLLTKNDSTFVLLSKYSVIIEGRNPKFDKIELGHGELSVCVCQDLEGNIKTFDMYGNDIDSVGYKPLVIDTTPDFSSPV
jgi:hypothetical protein